MDSGALIAVLVVVLVAVAVAALLLSRRRRTERLQQKFGPEYERAVTRTGDQRAAEAELAERAERRRELTIVPLDSAAHAAYQKEWKATQAKFVDDPGGATREADALVSRLMRDRGYPVDDDFDQQAAVVSVDHPDVVENYRAAHAVHRANEQGQAGTDDLREAFVHYRSLFAELLDADGDEREEAHR
jgi:hypothetical protein